MFYVAAAAAAVGWNTETAGRFTFQDNSDGVRSESLSSWTKSLIFRYRQDRETNGKSV